MNAIDIITERIGELQSILEITERRLKSGSLPKSYEYKRGQVKDLLSLNKMLYMILKGYH